jgi:hypothetical protein
LGSSRTTAGFSCRPDTCEVLLQLLGPRLEGPTDTPVFRNVHDSAITRFGIHTLVERTVVKVAKTMLSLREKRVSLS